MISKALKAWLSLIKKAHFIIFCSSFIVHFPLFRDILKNLKQHKDDDLRKGEAVKSQKVCTLYIYIVRGPLASIKKKCRLKYQIAS